LKSLAETIEWPGRSDAAPLAANEIHVWAVALDALPEALQNFSTTLSPEETERAKKFKFEKHRNRYIAGRGALRAILGPYLHLPAPELRFVYLSNGKPALGEDFANAGIHFNLAHTEDLALVAVTRIGRIGVDVERVRPVKNLDELVARFFSSRENDLFQKVPEPQKPAAFFNLWTRKEALLKATGEGITRSLSLVEVSFLPGDAARLMAISGDEAAARAWYMHELTPGMGFTAAVAVEGGTSLAAPNPAAAGEGGNIQHSTSNIEGGSPIEIKCWRSNGT
jgi:4'-phosphopantetheinyl transferase